MIRVRGEEEVGDVELAREIERKKRAAREAKGVVSGWRSARRDRTAAAEKRKVAAEKGRGCLEREAAGEEDLRERKGEEGLGVGRGMSAGGWKKGGLDMEARRWQSDQALMRRVAQVGSECM